MTTTTFVGATPKQQYWIDKILAERQVPQALAERAKGQLSKGEASKVLTALFELPKGSAVVVTQQVQPKQEAAKIGYYLLDGVPHVVVESKKTGHRVAKRLVLPSYKGGRAKWVYAKSVVFQLTGEPLTLAEAAQFGHMHGYCLCCGAALDVVLSVAAGIGPVCVKKHFGMTQLQWIQQRDLKGGE